MSRFPTCRLIVEHGPQNGAWNMAVDEALLESAAAGGIPTVRWYRWSRPTLSLGYFQKPDAAAGWLHSPEVDVVRRLTGGGAILHHHEWTYSVTLPALAPLLAHPYALYDLVHEGLCASLNARFGLSLALRGVAPVTTEGGTRGLGPPSAPEPVLCYLREDEHDVCCGGVKVIGSAQRRRRGALLQHGSVLLAESPFAPGIRGICDLVSRVDNCLEHAAEWQAAVARVIGETVEPRQLSADECADAERLFRSQVRCGNLWCKSGS